MLMLFIPSFHSMLWHLWPIICLENLLLEYELILRKFSELSSRQLSDLSESHCCTSSSYRHDATGALTFLVGRGKGLRMPFLKIMGL